jgi:hypothetical protein
MSHLGLGTKARHKRPSRSTSPAQELPSTIGTFSTLIWLPRHPNQEPVPLYDLWEQLGHLPTEGTSPWAMGLSQWLDRSPLLGPILRAGPQKMIMNKSLGVYVRPRKSLILFSVCLALLFKMLGGAGEDSSMLGSISNSLLYPFQIEDFTMQSYHCLILWGIELLGCNLDWASLAEGLLSWGICS